MKWKAMTNKRVMKIYNLRLYEMLFVTLDF